MAQQKNRQKTYVGQKRLPMAPYANLSYLMLRTAAAYVLAHLLRIAPRGDFDARLRRGRMA